MSLSSILRTAKPRMKKCEACGSPFAKQRMGQKVCGQGCAVVYAIAQKEKIVRKVLKLQKAKAKPLKDRKKETEKAVNEYARVRDRFDGCISCDKPAHWDGQWHASHFKSVGSNSALRYNLWNINKACSECNLFLSGNIREYEKRLVLKIGAEKVEWLKCQNRVTEYTAEYLDRLKRIAIKKTKRALQRQDKQVEVA
jgi:hypothetical protein